MSDPVTNVEIEDVLSSIRRLVSEDAGPKKQSKPARSTDRLVLTPALRVPENTGEHEPPRPAASPVLLTDPEPKESAETFQLQDAELPMDRDDEDPIPFEFLTKNDDADVEPETEMANDGVLNEVADHSDAGLEPEVSDIVEEQAEGFAFGIMSRLVEQELARVAKAEGQGPVESSDTDDVETDVQPESMDFAPDQDADAESKANDHGGDVAEDQIASDAENVEQPARAATAEALRALGAEFRVHEGDPDPIGEESEPEDESFAEAEENADNAAQDDAIDDGAEYELPETLEAKIAALEELVGYQSETDAPSLEEDVAPTFVHRPAPTLEWEDHAPDADELVLEASLEDLNSAADTGQAAMDAPASAPVELDEEMMRELVTQIIRQELQGVLGERITRNVRKLVRREIHRVLMSQEFD